ncbi:glycoside hydrolase family 20 zincin-like fold domain-containing protein, partial [Gelidibacter sp.]|uniref:glycoside hydrolase family 20 zincin-like fold domain-containing protein n=1 Tax=Gelidibacter sp. TaxID=2018083 RepID=UPI0032633A10
MRLIPIALIALLTLTNCEERTRSFSSSEIALLPKPASLDLNEGSFAITDGQQILADLEEQQNAAADFQAYITKTAGFKSSVVKSYGPSISFEKKEDLGPEAYELVVSPKKISILANGAAGYFYGVQTLKQLVAAETAEGSQTTTYLIP